MDIGILIYDGVELLDFAGPYEVFFTASRLEERRGFPKSFTVFTIGKKPFIRVRGGLCVQPDRLISEISHLDMMIVPGGVIDDVLGCSELMAFIARIDKTTQITASVCTGSLILSKLGLLEGLKCTTHWEDLECLAQNPNLVVLKEMDFVEDSKYITSGGIASGISMSLYLVKKTLSPEFAILTAKQMEYPYTEKD